MTSQVQELNELQDKIFHIIQQFSILRIVELMQIVFACTLQGLKFDVVPSTFEENLDKLSFRFAADYAKETARRKATEVAERLLPKVNLD